MRRYPGRFVAEPGSELSKTWYRLTGQVRIQIVPGHWDYDYQTKELVWIEPTFFSYIDYGVTSAWFPR